jgi:hypothetical protein
MLTSCWPTSVSFVDKGGMPEEWKTFYVTTLENNAPNTPLSYSAELSELIKDGVQNNSRLLLNTNSKDAEVNITGTITNYAITPVALQEGDQAAKNRLTVSVQFEIFISKPEEEEMNLTSTRFIDYEATTDLGVVESELLGDVNEQIVQDVINKLMSNW